MPLCKGHYMMHFDTTYLRVCPVSFMCVTCRIHMHDTTHSYVWHDSFICVTWLIHVCDMTHYSWLQQERRRLQHRQTEWFQAFVRGGPPRSWNMTLHEKLDQRMDISGTAFSEWFSIEMTQLKFLLCCSRLMNVSFDQNRCHLRSNPGCNLLQLWRRTVPIRGSGMGWLWWV